MRLYEYHMRKKLKQNKKISIFLVMFSCVLAISFAVFTFLDMKYRIRGETSSLYTFEIPLFILIINIIVIGIYQIKILFLKNKIEKNINNSNMMRRKNKNSKGKIKKENKEKNDYKIKEMIFYRSFLKNEFKNMVYLFLFQFDFYCILVLIEKIDLTVQIVLILLCSVNLLRYIILYYRVQQGLFGTNLIEARYLLKYAFSKNNHDKFNGPYIKEELSESEVVDIEWHRLAK